MGRRMPIGPLLYTALAVGAANVLIAWALVGLVWRQPVVTLGPIVLTALALIAVGSAVAATVGWRSYLRRGRA